MKDETKKKIRSIFTVIGSFLLALFGIRYISKRRIARELNDTREQLNGIAEQSEILADAYGISKQRNQEIQGIVREQLAIVESTERSLTDEREVLEDSQRKIDDCTARLQRCREILEGS